MSVWEAVVAFQRHLEYARCLIVRTITTNLPSAIAQMALTTTTSRRLFMNEDEVKKKLTSEEYEVLRKKGTEAPYSGKYLHESGEGIYNCKVCGNPLFSSDAKFDANNPGLRGWPSFDEALPGTVKFLPDSSFGMERTEVVCANCDSHLGHLFNDSEAKTGKHFCLNSICLDLQVKKQ